MKRETKTLLVLVLIVIAIIAIIYYVRGNNNSDEAIIKCIAKNSKVVISPTCSACAAQEKILGDYLNEFNLISIKDNPEILTQYNIKAVPTWIINNQTYTGVKTIDELADLTACKIASLP
ncbi:MAG: thioredoxin family protein [Candidatus Pacearchaeota archaeon]